MCTFLSVLLPDLCIVPLFSRKGKMAQVKKEQYGCTTRERMEVDLGLGNGEIIAGVTYCVHTHVAAVQACTK